MFVAIILDKSKPIRTKDSFTNEEMITSSPLNNGLLFYAGIYNIMVQTFILGARRRAKRGPMGKSNPYVNTTHKTMITSTRTNGSSSEYLPNNRIKQFYFGVHIFN
jgi:hypothetical protein